MPAENDGRNPIFSRLGHGPAGPPDYGEVGKTSIACVGEWAFAEYCLREVIMACHIDDSDNTWNMFEEILN